MARDEQKTQIHIRLITAMVNKLMDEGYTVSADHIGYPNGIPDKVKGLIPDISATKRDKKQIIEAETCDSLNTVDTKLQWIAFSSLRDVSFSVIIPQRCLSEAKKLAKQWGVKIEMYWSMDV